MRDALASYRDRRRRQQRRVPRPPGRDAVVRERRSRHRADRARAGALFPRRAPPPDDAWLLAALAEVERDGAAARAAAAGAPSRVALARARRLAPQRQRGAPARLSPAARRCARSTPPRCPAARGSFCSTARRHRRGARRRRRHDGRDARRAPLRRGGRRAGRAAPRLRRRPLVRARRTSTCSASPAPSTTRRAPACSRRCRAR